MPELKLSPAIRLRGVRHNNLKNFDLDLPLRRLIVITGLSGSGKSSLAFDTLYAEGQRRYIETFSPYARQFFDRMDKPQVDSIEGIPPAIAIEQRNAVRTTRSTVGTMTEICDHMKILWPHLAQLHCRQCAQPVRKDSPQNVWNTVLSSSKSQIEDESEGTGRKEAPEALITFELPLSEKLSIDESLALIAKQGYQRLLLNGEVVRLDELSSRITERATRLISLTVIQDRVKLTPANRARCVEACEQAYHYGKGKLAIHSSGSSQRSTLNPQLFSNRLHCAKCDLEYREPSPALFSFNHPLGACPACKGFGRTITIDYSLAIPDRSLTLAQGAIKPWRGGFSAECQRDLRKFCKIRQVPMDAPFSELSPAHQRWVIDGDEDYGMDDDHRWPRLWYGVKGYFKWLETKSYKMHVRVLLSRYRTYTKCKECDGQRFNKDAQLYRLPIHDLRSAIYDLKLTLGGAKQSSIVNSNSSIGLADFYALSVRDALKLMDALASSRNTHRATPRQPNDPISHALSEVRARLAYLDEVGLGYVTLDRPTRTLSGGETERVNLTTCLGTRLVNTLFVLDEPSVGLHPRDTDRLVRVLEKLRDTGNTVIVVEHEGSVMRAADQIVDLGPGHGATGGQVIFQGPFQSILKSATSLTGKYLSGRKRIEIPPRRLVGRTKPEHQNPKSEGHTEAASLRDADFALSSEFGSRTSDSKCLTITNATRHNLKNLSVEIPLNRFVCITGVSGSGKSTLVREVLYPALAERLKDKPATANSSDRPKNDEENEEDDASRVTPHDSRIAGYEHLTRAIFVDQAILGKTPRSNPAVYMGAFDDIREVFAQSETARQRGYNASAFSFNSAVGQCERCRGAGFEKIEMQFLSDVFIRCPECNGRRYRQHILEVKITRPGTVSSKSVFSPQPGKPAGRTSPILATRLNTDLLKTECAFSIADLLDSTVDEAIEFLNGFPESKPARRAAAGLKLLQEVGLGYLCLGQPINTLSGGESQRLKLVRHLADSTAVVGQAGERVGKRESGNSASHSPTLPPAQFRPDIKESDEASSVRTLFLFDEPTTGLHFDDVRVLLLVFQRLVDAGHSVVVVEHNLDVIKCADWVIDLGPEAGDAGGQIIAQGTPEQVAACERSHTGQALKRFVIRQRKVVQGKSVHLAPLL